jgi:hypothetical protein
MKPILFSCFFLCLLATSCKKQSLPKATIRTAFIQYPADEIDTLIFKRYGYGSHFTQFIDSTILTESMRTIITNNDTVTVFPSIENCYMNDNFDWEIINPSDHQSLKIENIQYNMIEYTSGIFAMDPPRGSSPVSSYILNGNQVSIPDGGQYGNADVYMTK